MCDSDPLGMCRSPNKRGVTVAVTATRQRKWSYSTNIGKWENVESGKGNHTVMYVLQARLIKQSVVI